jgi:hypothetical protein
MQEELTKEGKKRDSDPSACIEPLVGSYEYRHVKTPSVSCPDMSGSSLDSVSVPLEGVRVGLSSEGLSQAHFRVQPVTTTI